MKERLDLLLNAAVISAQAHRNCLEVVAVIDRQLAIPHDSEQYQMAVTHLARAADRIWQQQAIEEGLDNELMAEITAEECFTEVLTLHNQVLDAMALQAPPASEESYMLANIFALIQVAGEPDDD